MAGYLDQYGVADAKREGRIKKIVVTVVAAVVLGLTGYLVFRTWSQERVVKDFLATLAKGDYPAAYRMWGCTPEAPCRDYDRGRFDEDWGPKSPFSNASAAKVDQVEYCGTGVVFNLSEPGAEPVALWVERATNIITFSPWPQCPGKHLQLKQFWKKLFSSQS